MRFVYEKVAATNGAKSRLLLILRTAIQAGKFVEGSMCTQDVDVASLNRVVCAMCPCMHLGA